MRQRLNFTCLLIGCLLSLAACAQPASVGIPTPDQAALAAQAAAIAAAATASAIPPTIAPPPADTPAPEPVPTDIPPAPLPTEAPPTPVPPTPAPAASSNNSGSAVGCNQQIIHIVKPGENLFRIALRYHTTIYAIARRNGITNVRVVRAGQRLRIVTCARGGPSGPSQSRGATYVVRPGDNLFRIALRYGSSVQKIMAANNRYSSLIVPGQLLIIP